MMLRRFTLLFLPLVLLVMTGGLLGFYCETNDDLTIVALLRGETAAAPVADLHLYFHGFATLWSWLYVHFNTIPWYALSLYGLLYGATVLLFSFLDRLLRPRVGAWASVGFLVLFFGVAWLEHGFWFNYARVPVLLAGTGVLFAAQRAPARWALAVGLLAFALAWLIRPSMAIIGVVAAVPGAWWLAGRRTWPVLAGAAGWAATGAILLNLTWTPAATTFRRLDVLKSNLNDFHLAAPPLGPLSSKDSLALASTRQWMFADSTLINEAVLKRVAPLPSPRYFLAHIAPAKLAQLLPQLPRDYFPLLLLLAATVILLVQQRRASNWFWLVQLGYLGLLLVLGTVLKLPPRLALPLLDFWAVSNLVFLIQTQVPVRRSVTVVLVLLLLTAVPYGYKTWHRNQVLRQERRHNQGVRRQMYHLAHFGRSKVRVVVSDVLEGTYKAESPFNEGHAMLRYSKVLPSSETSKHVSIMGWQTLHPSQPALWHFLTGTRDFTEALRRLGTRPDVAWILTPEGAAVLNRQLALEWALSQPFVWLEAEEERSASSENAMHAYHIRVKF